MKIKEILKGSVIGELTKIFQDVTKFGMIIPANKCSTVSSIVAFLDKFTTLFLRYKTKETDRNI